MFDFACSVVLQHSSYRGRMLVALLSLVCHVIKNKAVKKQQILRMYKKYNELIFLTDIMCMVKHTKCDCLVLKFLGKVLSEDQQYHLTAIASCIHAKDDLRNMSFMNEDGLESTVM